jgi:hypothetical protein
VSILCGWNWLVKQKMLSDRVVYIAVRNVCWIIRHPSNGISFPYEIFAWDDSCEFPRLGSTPTRALPDVVVWRLLADLAPIFVVNSRLLVGVRLPLDPRSVDTSLLSGCQ